MAALGYAANWSGVTQYVEDLRTRFGTRWTYCGYFTKYQLGWFAYAALGGPRLVMDYANDGWGPDNIDRVFAHETGHIFGAPDEYASSGCSCDGAWGRFGVRNFPLLTLGFVPPIVEYLVVKLREFAFPGKFRRDLLHDRLETLSEPAVSCDGLVVPLESVARPEGVKVVEQTPCLKFLGV